RLTFVHSTPCVGGWSGSPVTLIARPFSTVTRIAQVSGQSCGQTARANSVGAFIEVGLVLADRSACRRGRDRKTRESQILLCSWVRRGCSLGDGRLSHCQKYR